MGKKEMIEIKIECLRCEKQLVYPIPKPKGWAWKDRVLMQVCNECIGGE